MKTSFLSFFLIGLLFSALSANQESTQDLKKIKCKIIIQAGEASEFRKIHAKELFHDIANTCNQIGKVTSVKGAKEKQKEACNLIASIFELIANVSKKHEKQQKQDEQKEQKNDTQQPEATTEDKKAVTDETINLVLGIVDVINDEESDEVLKSTPSLYLSMLKGLPDNQSRSIVIEKILNDKNEAIKFLEEIVDYINKIIFISIPEITNDLFESLKKIFIKQEESIEI